MRTKKVIMLFLCFVLTLSMLASGCAKDPTTNGEPTDGIVTTTENESTDGKETSPDVEQKVIRVALVAPFTGDAAQYGKQFERGARLMIEDFEKKDSFNGAKVELVLFDDKNDAKEAVNIGNKIVSDGNFAFVLGPFSSANALAISEVLDEEGILTISPSVSHANFISDYDYTFRVGQLNVYEGVFVAKYCSQKWDTKKIAGIYTNNDWGVSLAEEFEKEVANQGMELSANESFLVGQTKDFSPILTKIEASGADTLYLMCQYAEAGQIMRQVYDMGIDIKIVGSSASYKIETLELAGEEALQNIRWVNTFTLDNPDPVIQDFRKRVRETYDVEIDNFIVRSYDSMLVVLSAIDRCGSLNSDAVKKEIMNLREYNSVSGSFTIQDDRNVTRQFYVCVSKDGKSFEFFESPELK